MAERYTRLSSLPENQYTVGSPILIAAGALLKDNQTGRALAQIKFRSISEKQIKAVKISIAAFDVSGKELEGVGVYQYLDLTAARTAEFGHRQAVTLPDAVTRSIEIKCTDVFFADGTVWNATPDAVWTSLPTQETVAAQLGGLAAQYQRDTTPKSKFIPIEYEDLWRCSCGEINHSEETKCHNCHHNKDALFDALDIDALRQRDDEHRAAEAEKAAADAAQRIKTKKIAIITIAIFVIIISLIWLSANILTPNSLYNNAVALMEAGKYEEAIAIFEALNEHKDSIEKISVCEIGILDNQYDNAVALMEAGKYEGAIAIFEALNEHKDSIEKISVCEIGILDNQYDNAVALMEAGKYVEAADAFYALNGYKDSDKQAILSMHYLLSIIGHEYQTTASSENEYVLSIGFSDIFDFYDALKTFADVSLLNDQAYDIIRLYGEWSGDGVTFSCNDNGISYSIPWIEPSGDYYNCYNHIIYTFSGEDTEENRTNQFKIVSLCDSQVQFYAFRDGKTYTLLKIS